MQTDRLVRSYRISAAAALRETVKTWTIRIDSLPRQVGISYWISTGVQSILAADYCSPTVVIRNDGQDVPIDAVTTTKRGARKICKPLDAYRLSITADLAAGRITGTIRNVDDFDDSEAWFSIAVPTDILADSVPIVNVYGL